MKWNYKKIFACLLVSCLLGVLLFTYLNLPFGYDVEVFSSRLISEGSESFGNYIYPVGENEYTQNHILKFFGLIIYSEVKVVNITCPQIIGQEQINFEGDTIPIWSEEIKPIPYVAVAACLLDITLFLFAILLVTKFHLLGEKLSKSASTI